MTKHLVSICAAMLMLGSSALADTVFDRTLEKPWTSWLGVPSWVRAGIIDGTIEEGRAVYGARFWLTRKDLESCLHNGSRNPRIHPSKTIGDALGICWIAEQPFPLPPKLDLMTEDKRNELTEVEREKLSHLRRLRQENLQLRQENRRLRQEKDSQPEQDHGAPGLTAKREKRWDPGISKEVSPTKFACGKIKQLYEELQGFVGNSKFHDYRYAKTSPAHDWHNRVLKLVRTDGLIMKIGRPVYAPYMLIIIGRGLSMDETKNRSYLTAVETTENFLSWCSKQSF